VSGEGWAGGAGAVTYAETQSPLALFQQDFGLGPAAWLGSARSRSCSIATAVLLLAVCSRSTEARPGSTAPTVMGGGHCRVGRRSPPLASGLGRQVSAERRAEAPPSECLWPCTALRKGQLLAALPPRAAGRSGEAGRFKEDLPGQLRDTAAWRRLTLEGDPLQIL